ncbi:MAG: hypothetical protein IJ561_09340 [Ruminococcus sp.]|nr:hypothetical protein [Ruminococcus sp.]MBR1394024.1 hypothetical protein [Ruminococcus sp.]
MDARAVWSRTRDELKRSLAALGYPAELGNIIAEHIGSPRGMERMISYLDYVKPDRVELIVDEMLAIKSDVDRWREKKECERANAVYNSVLNYGLDTDDEE